MPESSDNPTPEEIPPANPDATAKAAGSAAPVAPLPRAARPADNLPQSGDTHIKLSDLMALARTLTGAEGGVGETEAERALISRQQRKFSRADGKAGRRDDADKSGDPSADSLLPDTGERLTLPGAGDAASSSSRGEAPLASMTQRTRRTRSSSRGPGLLVPAAILITLGVLGGGGWYVWKFAQFTPQKAAPAFVPTASPPPQAAVPTLTQHEFETIDKIMQARKAGEPAKALALCVLLRSEGSTIPGLSYLEAQFAAATNDAPAAAVAINRSLEANEEVSGCYMLRAALLARQGKPEAALHDYGSAAQADPFAPKPYFFWGEALRRAGHPQAALMRIREAIDRAGDPDSEDFYRFKERLTLVEMDRSGEFADDLKAKLALNPPPPDWLLTAAAVELRQDHFEAAASFLSRAAAELTPEQFKNRLGDYYFFGFAHEPALAAIYAPVLEQTAKRPTPAPTFLPPPPAVPVLNPSPGPNTQELVSPVAPAPDLAKPTPFQAIAPPP